MSQDHILTQVDGALGRIHLNRVEALNSLDLGMVQAIGRSIDAFEADTRVTAVAISGEGRSLCAGGDIKMIWRVGRDAPEEALAFWAAEYRLNARIARLRKPWVAIMDGICMGGGVGLSVHGSHRVVTERTRFAMPETGIGYFPDVGGTHALARAPHRLGFWIGLTGATIDAADTMAAGLADVMVPSAAIPAVLQELAAGGDVDAVLQRHSADPGPSRLTRHASTTKAAFAGHVMAAIIATLRADGSAFAIETVDLLAQRSPTSLVLTLHRLQQALQARDLETCLDQDYATNVRILEGHDFYEGVRAALVDKDRAPNWRPASLAEVDRTALIGALTPQPSLFPIRSAQN